MKKKKFYERRDYEAVAEAPQFLNIKGLRLSSN